MPGPGDDDRGDGGGGPDPNGGDDEILEITVFGSREGLEDKAIAAMGHTLIFMGMGIALGLALAVDFTGALNYHWGAGQVPPQRDTTLQCEIVISMAHHMVAAHNSILDPPRTDYQVPVAPLAARPYDTRWMHLFDAETRALLLAADEALQLAPLLVEANEKRMGALAAGDADWAQRHLEVLRYYQQRQADLVQLFPRLPASSWSDLRAHLQAFSQGTRVAELRLCCASFAQLATYLEQAGMLFSDLYGEPACPAASPTGSCSPR